MSDRYYEPDSSDDDYPDWFPDRVADLMKSIYNPHKFSMFCEAFEGVQKPETVAEIEEMLEKNQFEALGRKLWNIAYEYCERFAEDSAQEDWEKGYRD